MFGRKLNKIKKGEKGRRGGKHDKVTDQKPRKTSSIRKQTARSALAVVCFALAVIALMAAVGQAGQVGNWLYDRLGLVLGLGYFLLPTTGVLAGILLLRQTEEQKMFVPGQAAGIVLFLVSGLGILSMLINQGGGLLGNTIASPVTALLDTSATMIILSALFLVALIILFELELSRIFRTMPAPISALYRAIRGKLQPAQIPQTQTEQVQENTALMPGLSGDTGAMANGARDAEEKYSHEPENSSPPTESTEAAKNRKGYEFALPKFDHLYAYTPPPSSLLEGDRGKPSVGDIKANTNIIKRTLANFGITVEMDEVSIGPSVTRYALKPAEGVKLAKIVGLKNDLALALAAHPIRIEAPIPGKSLVGIEIPNTSKATVGMGTLIELEEFRSSSVPLLITLGKSIAGKAYFANLAKMPHMLIAGATGSGKSVTIHALINSLLFRNSPEALQIIMIDPKRVELTLYNGIPHLLTPVITQAKQALLALKWAAKEMDRRYDILEGEKVRDIDSYHQNVVLPAYKKAEKQAPKNKRGEDEAMPDLPERMPYIIVIIDELADLMQAYPRELEAAVVRIAQMSRAVGIHLVLSTQRPSVNIITGLIKANIPSRIALQVASQIDSRTILDMSGAESLLGAGDMLFVSGEMSKPMRLQSAFITEKEVKRVVGYIKGQYDGLLPNELYLTTPTQDSIGMRISLDEMNSDVDSAHDDALYEEAREVIISAKKASTSLLQRKLRIGYGRAARLIDILEERGVVGPSDGAKGREVLVNTTNDQGNNNSP